MFGPEPVDFEAQIAELNASAARRRGIRDQIKRAKDAAARIAAWVKSKPKKKIVCPKAALREKPPEVPTRIKEMVQDFYEPNPQTQPPDPWDEDAKEVKRFRAKIVQAKRQGKKDEKKEHPKTRGRLKAGVRTGKVWAQVGMEFARREKRGRVVTLVVLPLLALAVLLAAFERHNVLEIKGGEISLTEVSWFGACEREIKRLPVGVIVSVENVFHVGFRGSSSYEVRILERTGAVFNSENFSGICRCGRANREERLLKEALLGHSEYRSRQFFRSGLTVLSAALALVALFRHLAARRNG